MTPKRRTRVLGLGSLTFLMATASARARYQAGIEGTVTHTSGASVPGATVIAANQETGVSAEPATNASGFYRVSNLSPGT